MTAALSLSLSLSLSFFLLSSFFFQCFTVPEQLFSNPEHTILPHHAVKFQCSFLLKCARACHMSHLIDKPFPPSVLHGLQITMSLAYMYNTTCYNLSE